MYNQLSFDCFYSFITLFLAELLFKARFVAFFGIVVVHALLCIAAKRWLTLMRSLWVTSATLFRSRYRHRTRHVPCSVGFIVTKNDPFVAAFSIMSLYSARKSSTWRRFVGALFDWSISVLMRKRVSFGKMQRSK